MSQDQSEIECSNEQLENTQEREEQIDQELLQLYCHETIGNKKYGKALEEEQIKADYQKAVGKGDVLEWLLAYNTEHP